MEIGRSASSIWRQNGRDVFLTSPIIEDDEEALRWAALEKLPTYQRVRVGVLAAGEDGERPREVDIMDLGLLEKKNLLERLVKTAEEDNERFLLKLKHRIDRVGINIPTIEVRFDHLSIDAETYTGSRAMPTIFNFYVNLLEGFLNSLRILPSRKKPFTILRDVSGIIKPGRLTLLLGPPSSGKTTLLLALAGKLDSALKVSGKVTYNGHEMNEFVPQRSAAYISQHDIHLGEMTVRETLAFSARCQGVGPRYDMLMELARREKEAQIKPDPDLDIFMKAAALGGQEANVITDYTIKILGLEVCADTMVGNEMVRGISGGQKKRVTTGEMMVGSSMTLLMDEISTGLDSSTTHQIVNSLRQNNHILMTTTCISLLQPTPETYNLFDDIMLLSDGRIVYQGPRENAIEFFEHMGFKCPERKGVADFLQEVTSKKDQQQYWARRDEPYRFIAVREFVDAFQSFHVGSKIDEELSVPFDKSKSHPAALTKNRYGISKKELLKALTAREFLLMKRNSFLYVFKTIQLFILSTVASTLFLRTNLSKDTVPDGTLYLRMLFFGVMILMFNGIAELAMTISRLPVFYKQRDLQFFPAWTYTLPTSIIKIPHAVIDSIVWTCVTYYTVGFDPNIGRFFKQFVILLLVNLMAGGLFRLVASVTRVLTVASTIAIFNLLTFLSFGGFILSRKNMKSWWTWGYWCSPVMYAQNAVSVNEFLGHSWNKIVVVTYPNVTGNLGKGILESHGIFTDSKWFRIGVGALIGYVFLFNSLFTLAMAFLKPLGKSQTILTKEGLAENMAATEGISIELSSRAQTSTDSGDVIQRIGSSAAASVSRSNTKKAMVLPFEPLSITFDEIRYSIDMPLEMKAKGLHDGRLELLKGISGAFRPGVLTALMGVSGAGKTTFMDVLAGRKTRGYIDGNITISGYPKRQETFARICGYCEQTDIHSPNITVYESLEYSAWLRLSSDIDAKSRKAFVEEVLELIELTSLKGALVGMPGVNGLSTEQRKRLTIAVELVANPSIIFMDEPTSGLDARAATIVMRTVRNTVDTGRTVVCTIHQPSIDIFEAFDELFLMKRGGEEIYVGPLGRHSCDLVKYFESIDGVSKIKDGYNPSTWMLEVSSLAQEVNLGVDFAEIYKNSDLKKRNKELINVLSSPAPSSRDLYFPTQFAQSFFVQFLACLWKQRLSYWRNPSYTAIRLMFSTVTALLLGTIFWDLGQKREDHQDIFNAMGSMYVAIIFLGATNAGSVQPVVAIERTVSYRERAAGMYSAIPYAFGQIMIEVPYVFVQAIIYGLVTYAMIGFDWTVAKFCWYIFFMYVTLLFYTLYGMMAVAVTPNHNIAAIISTTFYGIWNLFSGFIIPKPSIPCWWRWYYYSCPVAWTLHGLVASQFGDVEDELNTQQKVNDFIKDYFDFDQDMVPWAAVILVGFVVLFAFIFAFSIKKFNLQKR